MTVDPSELVNLDITIARFIAPRIAAFRAAPHGPPAGLEPKAWDAVLADMQFAWEHIGSDAYFGPTDDDRDERVIRGMNLFHEYLGHLWQ
jgi:hypothetical protein